MINLNQLRSFYLCALHKNVTKAAMALDVSQPSLSQQLRAFEEEVGFDLFFRNGRAFDLTPKGRDLFFKSQPIFNSIAGVVDFLEAKTNVQRSYSIGVTEQVERPFVSKVTSSLIKNGRIHSSKISVLSNTHDDLQIDFHKGFLDVFLTHQKLKGKNPYHVFELPVKLVTSKKGFESSKIKQSNLQGLISGLGEQLILPTEGMQLRTEIDIHLSDFDKASEVIFESNIISCLTEAIKSGIGCGLIPVPYIYDEFKKNKVSVLGPEKGFWSHNLYLYSKNEQSQLIADAFIKTIQEFDL